MERHRFKEPKLIALRLRQTLDYWMKDGVNLSNRSDILASPYRTGLTSAPSAHPDPQPNVRGRKFSIKDFNLFLIMTVVDIDFCKKAFILKSGIKFHNIELFKTFPLYW
jgi:hypothetical protein